MYTNIKKERFLTLCFLIFSSLGFSVGIIITKIFSDNTSLAYILKLQSYVVFFSFILQFGLRAALRVQIYNNRKRLAEVTYSSLYIILVFFSVVVTLVEIYLGNYIFFALSCLLSIVTLKLTMNVANNIFKSILCYSIVNFFVASGSSFILLMVNDFRTTEILIESFSVILLFIMYRRVKWSRLYGYRKNIIWVYWNAQSYQLGSSIVALFIFFLTQSAVLQFQEGSLKAYSVAIIFSGFIVLIIGQVMLLVERNLYSDKDNKYSLYMFLLIMQILISMLFSLILSYMYGSSWQLMSLVMFILLSRITAGYIVQYVQVNRFILNYISGIFFVGYSIFYFAGFRDVDISYHIYPVIIFLVLGLFLLKKNEITVSG